jgi:hypothetical protein
MYVCVCEQPVVVSFVYIILVYFDTCIIQNLIHQIRVVRCHVETSKFRIVLCIRS